MAGDGWSCVSLSFFFYCPVRGDLISVPHNYFTSRPIHCARTCDHCCALKQCVHWSERPGGVVTVNVPGVTVNSATARRTTLAYVSFRCHGTSNDSASGGPTVLRVLFLHCFCHALSTGARPRCPAGGLTQLILSLTLHCNTACSRHRNATFYIYLTTLNLHHHF